MTLTSHQRPHHGLSNVWLTPPEIMTALGHFDLDPCAAPEPRPWPTADTHYVEAQDGLSMPWSGFVWCNPPFGPDAGRWLARMAEHGNGIALCAARTETRWFVSSVWNRAGAILFLHGRPHFHRPDGTRGAANSGVPICLIAYGPEAFRRLSQTSLAGSFVPLVENIENTLGKTHV